MAAAGRRTATALQLPGALVAAAATEELMRPAVLEERLRESSTVGLICMDSIGVFAHRTIPAFLSVAAHGVAWRAERKGWPRP